jgi:Sigma 54 modulation protein / S30EA ribosomal protein
MRVRDIMKIGLVRGRGARLWTGHERRQRSNTPGGLRAPLPAFLPRPAKVTRDRMDAASLPAHVRVIGGAIPDEDRDYIARKLGIKLGRFVSSIERITVRLSDVNGPKGGRDLKCQIKVVLSGLRSVVVHQTESTLTRTIERAIDAVSVAVHRTVQRRRLKPLHHRAVDRGRVGSMAAL